MVQVNLDLSNWILPIATAVGSYGMMPAAPGFIQELGKNELVQYFLLFTLIWQGGGGQDVGVSAMMTLAFFIFHKLMSGAITVAPAPAPAPAPAVTA